METEAHPSTVRARLAKELKQYAAISLYLYVCFGALLFYKSAILGADGIAYAPYGLATVKALILGKFMLVLHAMRIGEGQGGRPLIQVILCQSLVFLAVLVALTYVEEMASGLVHGRPVGEAIAAVGGGTWMGIVATAFLLWLILVPYFAWRQIDAALGPGRLRGLLFGPR